MVAIWWTEIRRQRMFHMLTCFSLKSAASIDDFRQSLADLEAHLKELDLVHSTGSIGRRHRHAIMDTDAERDHEYYVIVSFRDRAQCDRAVEYVLPHKEPVESIHKAVYSNVEDAIFTCWEDL
jgi:hypothetical protein